MATDEKDLVYQNGYMVWDYPERIDSINCPVCKGRAKWMCDCEWDDHHCDRGHIWYVKNNKIVVGDPHENSSKENSSSEEEEENSPEKYPEKTPENVTIPAQGESHTAENIVYQNGYMVWNCNTERDSYRCPTCKGRVKMICDCKLNDHRCANGHVWYVQDNKIIAGNPHAGDDVYELHEFCSDSPSSYE